MCSAVGSCAEKPLLPFQVTELEASAAVWRRNWPTWGPGSTDTGVVDLLAPSHPAFLLVNRGMASGDCCLQSTWISDMRHRGESL